jgi:transcriptional regulator with XRE-family HTH domain
MTVSRRVIVARRTLPDQFAAIIRDARHAMGWTQDELASRSGTSQTRVWRLERGDPTAFEPALIDEILESLGVRLSLAADARHLDDRARQRDAVHARLQDAVARRLERLGWHALTEVGVGGDRPRGWIDLLGFRETDSAVALGEMKTLMTDAGELQRQMTYYTREAPWAARRAGWQARTIVPFVVALDTQAVANALRENAGLLKRAFPGHPDDLVRWLTTPGSPAPSGATLVVTDLAARRSLSFRASVLNSRARRATYVDYADAAATLRRARRRA